MSASPARGVRRPRGGAHRRDARSAACSRVLSIAAIVFLVRAWSVSPRPSRYGSRRDWLRWILVVAMLPAFLLFVASVSQPQSDDDRPARRDGAATARHDQASRAIRCCGRSRSGPRCTSSATATRASIVFFGAFLVTALAGMPSIDAKLARRDPATWQALSAATSIVPFAAIAAGRNRFVPREIGWLAPVLGLAAWAVLLWLHPLLFGVAPVRW